MNSIELFSGCGGLALGLARAGFEHRLMVEWNNDAVSTVLHNKAREIDHVKHWPIVKEDVRSIDWARYSKNLVLAAGGPPCQPFSIGGKHGGAGDDRDMWPQAVRAVGETSPEGFIFENVKGLTRPKFASYLKWIVAALSRPSLRREPKESLSSHLIRLEASRRPLEYRVKVVKVNAADYGAPQKRHRVIIAGIRADSGLELSEFVPTHSRERLLWDQWVTGSYWKRHGRDMPSIKAIPRMDRAMVAKLKQAGMEPWGSPWVTVRDALLGLGEPNGRNNHMRQDGAKVYAGHTGCPLDQPAKALKAGDHGVPGGENMMVLDSGKVRYFTMREAARLQGLPDDYEFPSSWTESMRQLGNAVPAQLSEAVGHWIRGHLVEARRSRRAAA